MTDRHELAPLVPEAETVEPTRGETSHAEASATTFTNKGSIPPVATTADPHGPTASERAFEPDAQVDLVTQESGMSPDVLGQLQGNEELARFTEAVLRRQQIRARVEQIQLARDQERAGFAACIPSSRRTVPLWD